MPYLTGYSCSCSLCGHRSGDWCFLSCSCHRHLRLYLSHEVPIAGICDQLRRMPRWLLQRVSKLEATVRRPQAQLDCRFFRLIGPDFFVAAANVLANHTFGFLFVFIGQKIAEACFWKLFVY